MRAFSGRPIFVAIAALVTAGQATSAPAPKPVAAAASGPDQIVQFERGSNSLTPAFKSELDGVAVLLSTRLLEGTCIRITGHSDTAGDAAFNMQLSAQRAQIVADYLGTQTDLAPEMFELRYMGEMTPILGISGTDPRNRRVEIEARYAPAGCNS